MLRVDLVGLLVAVVGCTEPAGALIGHFGGRLMELSATRNSAVFRLACGRIYTPSLIQDRDGTARVRGTAVFEGAGVQPVVVDIEVRVLDEHSVSAMVAYPSGVTESFLLVHGGPSDFSGVRCLSAG